MQFFLCFSALFISCFFVLVLFSFFLCTLCLHLILRKKTLSALNFGRKWRIRERTWVQSWAGEEAIRELMDRRDGARLAIKVIEHLEYPRGSRTRSVAGQRPRSLLHRGLDTPSTRTVGLAGVNYRDIRAAPAVTAALAEGSYGALKSSTSGNDDYQSQFLYLRPGEKTALMRASFLPRSQSGDHGAVKMDQCTLMQMQIKKKRIKDNIFFSLMTIMSYFIGLFLSHTFIVAAITFCSRCIWVCAVGSFFGNWRSQRILHFINKISVFY